MDGERGSAALSRPSRHATHTHTRACAGHGHETGERFAHVLLHEVNVFMLPKCTLFSRSSFHLLRLFFFFFFPFLYFFIFVVWNTATPKGRRATKLFRKFLSIQPARLFTRMNNWSRSNDSFLLSRSFVLIVFLFLLFFSLLLLLFLFFFLFFSSSS